jgi:hypothetical protein
MADELTPSESDARGNDARTEPHRKDAPRKLPTRDVGSLVLPVVAIAAGAVFSSGVLLVALADDDACARKGKPTFAQQVRRDVVERFFPTPRVAGGAMSVRQDPPMPLSPEQQPHVAGGLEAPDPDVPPAPPVPPAPLVPHKAKK